MNPNQVAIPQWDITDRLRKARRTANVSTADMAQYLGTSERLVSALETGTREARDAYLRSWAELCRVPFEWLKWGDNGPSPRDGIVDITGPARSAKEDSGECLRWLEIYEEPVAA
jgi:transcriptional regulator with XRE-family HTH domain